MKKVIKDEYGVKLKYPNRECKTCAKYPCFEGIDKCKSVFAKYGCTFWKTIINDSSG